MATPFYCHWQSMECGVVAQRYDFVSVTMCPSTKDVFLHILIAGNVALFKHLAHYGPWSDFQHNNLTPPFFPSSKGCPYSLSGYKQALQVEESWELLLSYISTFTFLHQVPRSKVPDVKRAGIDIENIVISSVLKSVIGSIPR